MSILMNYELYQYTLDQFVRGLGKENLLCILLTGSLLSRKIHRYSDIDLLLIVGKSTVRIRYVVEEVNGIRICQYWFTEEALLKRLFQEKLEIISKILREAHPVYLNHNFENTLQLIKNCSKNILARIIEKETQDDYDNIKSLHKYLEQNQDLNNYEHQILHKELILKMTYFHHALIFNTIEKYTYHLKNLSEKDCEFVNLITQYYGLPGQIQEGIVQEMVNHVTNKWKQKK